MSTTGTSALDPIPSLPLLKSAKLPQSPDRHQLAARVVPFPARRVSWIHRLIERPLLRTSYRVFNAVFVAVWLLFLGSLSFLAMVIR